MSLFFRAPYELRSLEAFTLQLADPKASWRTARTTVCDSLESTNAFREQGRDSRTASSAERPTEGDKDGRVTSVLPSPSYCYSEP